MSHAMYSLVCVSQLLFFFFRQSCKSSQLRVCYQKAKKQNWFLLILEKSRKKLNVRSLEPWYTLSYSRCFVCGDYLSVMITSLYRQYFSPYSGFQLGILPTCLLTDCRHGCNLRVGNMITSIYMRQCEIKDIKLYQVRIKIIAPGWY